MDRKFPIVLSSVIALFFIAIVLALLPRNPRHKRHALSETEISVILDSVRAHLPLPRKVGPIGTLDSVSFKNNTFVWHMTAYGDHSIMLSCKEHYDEYRNLLKYTVLIMNAQNGGGRLLALFLDYYQLNFSLCAHYLDGEVISFTFTGNELKEFAELCQMNPTGAVQHVIETHIAIANLSLPITPNDLVNSGFVTTNSIIKGCSPECLLQSIDHIGNDVIFTYNIDDNEIDFSDIIKMKNNDYCLEVFVKAISEDDDVKSFWGLLAISHSNLIYRMVCLRSGSVASIVIPYKLLRKYCDLPYNLFTQD